MRTSRNIESTLFASNNIIPINVREALYLYITRHDN